MIDHPAITGIEAVHIPVGEPNAMHLHVRGTVLLITDLREIVKNMHQLLLPSPAGFFDLHSQRRGAETHKKSS